MQNLAGLAFDPPAEFLPDEQLVSFRAPPPDLKSPMLLNKQLTVRPNLMVHRRPAGGSIEMICGEICAELVSAIPGMDNLVTGHFAFADGVQGMLLSFDFPANDARVRQFLAMRIDNGMLTTLTLSVDGATLNEAAQKRYLGSLASARAEGSPS
jgi:hypothetical protein